MKAVKTFLGTYLGLDENEAGESPTRGGGGWGGDNGQTGKRVRGKAGDTLEKKDAGCKLWGEGMGTGEEKVGLPKNHKISP